MSKEQQIAFRNRHTIPLIPKTGEMLFHNTILVPETLVKIFPEYSRFRRSETSPGLYVCQECIKPPSDQAVVAIMGPTAVGKNAVIRMIQEKLPPEKYTRIASATTRPMSKERNETPEDHLFVSKKEFEKMRRQPGRFIETIHQHNHWYGTTVEQIQKALDTHAPIVIWEGDVFGFPSIQKWLRENTPVPSISIFLLPAMPIKDYAKRIYETRGRDFVFRFPKSMAELKRAATTVDALILNPPSPDGKPTEAFYTLMQFLGENVRGI